MRVRAACTWCNEHEIVLELSPDEVVEVTGRQKLVAKAFRSCPGCGNQTKATVHVNIDRFTRSTSKRGRPDQGVEE